MIWSWNFVMEFGVISRNQNGMELGIISKNQKAVLGKS